MKINETEFMNEVVSQLIYIRDHGCSGIKCKHCSLEGKCDRNAVNSKQLAANTIAYLISKGKK